MLFLLIFLLQSASNRTNAPIAQPPVLRNGAKIITYEDYPTEAMRQNAYGIVSSLVHVSSDGKVNACDVTESSGSSVLDNKSCALIKSRAKFDPARDKDGAAVAGVFRLVNIWGIDANQPRASIVVTLHIVEPFSGYKDPTTAQLVLDATGHVKECNVTDTSGSVTADLFVCDAFRREFTIAPPKSVSVDVPAEAVRNITVILTTKQRNEARK